LAINATVSSEFGPRTPVLFDIDTAVQKEQKEEGNSPSYSYCHQYPDYHTQIASLVNKQPLIKEEDAKFDESIRWHQQQKNDKF